ncbi:MAG: right-handed parallel beta-helix repeat-containing protein [Planctomycetota bacterium]|jgi:hypothetical protein
MRWFLTAAAVLVTALTPALAEQQSAGTQLFVAIDGSDQNPGTQQKPFGTLAKARDAVRQLVASGLEADVKVLIREGTYRLSEPLTFGPEDSGTEDHAIVYAAYPSEKVVLSGGQPIAGWKRGEGDVWTARVEEAKDNGWSFRNLFVGGRRGVRARGPNQGVEPDCRQLRGVELSEDRSRFTVTLEPGLLADWQNAGDVEVMIAGNWAINRKRVQSIDAAANRVVLAPPHKHGPAYIFPSPGRWCYFENARELLDEPGEWYLDRRTGILSYWPRPGEDMTEIEVVAPVLTQLVVVAGTADRPVRNLHFKGLRFEHTDWSLPADGYMGIQACHYGKHDHPGRRWKHVPAAVCFTGAERCTLEDCSLARLGGTGIELADRCRHNVVRGNRVVDASANGLMVSGAKDEAEVPKDNRIDNNHVCACGREYYGAVGIWVGFAQRTAVTHNLVHDLPYSGISVGWEWNPNPTSCKENLVEANHVYDVMNRLCDGGCIYTLGFQPGTVIRGNHLHDVHRSFLAQGAPNNGMFIDQGSKGYLFERNVIYNTAAQLVRFNQCAEDWHTWRDNHFGEPEKVKQSGAEIIAAAGLEASYRERLAACDPADGR